MTLLVEGLGMAVLLGLGGRSRSEIARCTGICLLVNLVCHTTFWFAFPRVATTLPGGLLTAEGLVVLVEAIAYRLLCRIHLWQALLLSFVLNLLSLIAGVEIWRL